MDRNKKIILILDVLLFVGLLVYSVIFLIINKSLNPATIGGKRQKRFLRYVVLFTL